MGRRPLLAAVTALALLAGCGERHDVQPVAQLPPPQAPDTSSMGAGPSNASCGLPALPREALDRINAARAAGHRCGARRMSPTFALKWDPALYSAAAGHSLDMAKGNYFDHRSPSGSTVKHRATASNYNWKMVGENLAAGDTNVAEVVQGWLDSPEHCENLMDPAFNDVAVACVQQPGTQWGTYWTMMLGRKR